MFKFCIHKWVILAENDKWVIEKCLVCGIKRNREKFYGGYQPLPPIKEK